MGLRASVCLTASCGLFLIGCPSFSNLKTARALDQGEFQFTVAPEVGAVSIPQSAGTDQNGNVEPLAQFELAARVGVVDGFDLGLKLWVAGIELDSTISLLRGGFDLALAPGVGFFGFAATVNDNNSNQNQSGSLYEVPVYLPLLAGVNFGPGHQFVFGVEAIPVFILSSTSSSSSGGFNGSASGVELFLGGTLGVSFRLGSSVRIMPEFSVFAPVAGASSFNSGSIQAFGNTGAIIFQGGLAFSFGGDGFGKSRAVYVAPPM